MGSTATFLWFLLAFELLGLLWLVLFFRLRSPNSISAERVVRFRIKEDDTERGTEQNWPLFIKYSMLDLDQTQRDAIAFLFGYENVPSARYDQSFAVGRISFAATSWLLGYLLLDTVLDQRNVHVLTLIATSAGFAVAAWWSTGKYLYRLARERRNRISSGMPYALDLILICLDSGTALETAIVRVADELSERDPMVSAELLRTLADINLLGNRELAFRNLGDRVDTDNMYSIVGVLCQALQYGSSLSVALKDAIENMKRVELITLEERAGKLPVQLTIPGLIFTFPQVMILLAGPGVLSLLDTLAST